MAVIDLAAKRIERGIHKSGPVRCLGCKHEWVAVSPIGTITFECPQCRLMKGVSIGVMSTQFAQWQCCCGEYTFFIDAKGPYCAHCGVRPEHLTDLPGPA